MLITNSDKKIVKVPCIYEPIWFHEKQERALLDNGSEVNTINLSFARNLGIKARKTNVKAQKIDGFALETFGIVTADFQIENKANKPRFY